MSDILVVIPIYNEKIRIGPLLHRIRSLNLEGVDYLFVDDCSNDGTETILEHTEFNLVRHENNLGCGLSVRTGLEYGREKNYPCVVVMAGNGKDDPFFIPNLAGPVLEGHADIVQGSRYLAGGMRKSMPLHRRIGTRGYSFIASILLRKWISDATNGFRAVSTDILKKDEINLRQSWFKSYEVESYLLSKAILLGYRVIERPVSKNYPEDADYSKMSAFSGWWSHFRPILFLSLGLKR
ncbi:glycosyltransferase family 2 protein [Acidobacteriota bacterium]